MKRLASSLSEDGVNQEDGSVDDGQGSLGQVLVSHVTLAVMLEPVMEIFFCYRQSRHLITSRLLMTKTLA